MINKEKIEGGGSGGQISPRNPEGVDRIAVNQGQRTCKEAYYETAYQCIKLII